MLRYRVRIGTDNGAVLDFPQFGQGEKLTAFAIARFQSLHAHTPWTEVWDGDEKLIRYIDGMPAAWATPEVFKEHTRSFQRYEIFGQNARITVADGEDDYDNGWGIVSRR